MHRVPDKTLSRRERRQLWDEIIQDYLSSGESIQAYSTKYELNYDQLSYYIRSSQQKAQNHVKFIPVNTTHLTSEEKLTIRYGSVMLDMPLTIPVTLLCQIVQGLKSC